MKLIQNLKLAVYLLGGKKPFFTGYSAYKEKRISEILARGEFAPKLLPDRYGVRLDERVIEYPWFFAGLPSRPGKLLDAGSVLNFDYILERPSLQNKQIFISTLAPESRRQLARPNVSQVYEDLRDTCFKDNYFDWVVSLSTLEHIGLDNTRFYTSDASKEEHRTDAYLLVVKELKRVLKPGGVLYVSVPFGRYRNHRWLQVFNAAMVDAVLRVFAPASYVEDHFRYERDGWHVSSREDSQDATYFDYHQSKTHDGDYAAAARAVVCLEIMK